MSVTGLMTTSPLATKVGMVRLEGDMMRPTPVETEASGVAVVSLDEATRTLRWSVARDGKGRFIKVSLV